MYEHLPEVRVGLSSCKDRVVQYCTSTLSGTCIALPAALATSGNVYVLVQVQYLYL